VTDGGARRREMRFTGEGGFKAKNIQICIYTDLHFPKMSNESDTSFREEGGE